MKLIKDQRDLGGGGVDGGGAWGDVENSDGLAATRTGTGHIPF